MKQMTCKWKMKDGVLIAKWKMRKVKKSLTAFN